MNVPSQEEIGFRPFEPGDILAATKLAWDAWARGGEEEDEDTEEVDPRVMEGYVSSFIMRSNWNEVAHDSNGVIGIMFGRIDALAKGGGGIRSALRELRLIPGFLFNRYGDEAVAPIVVWHFLMTELKVLLNKPRSDAEINLIIVDTGHRGKGIGRTLVERFIKAAKEAGSRQVTLYTDDQVSNWKFYEIIGFRRVATFHDGLTSYFAETNAKAIVYALDLK